MKRCLNSVPSLFSLIVMLASGGSVTAHAQSLQGDPERVGREARVPGDIIVTARKRAESVLNVPVVETVVTQGRLEQLQVTDIKDLQKLVPGLALGHGLPSVGALVSIRGVGTSAQDPGVDQSVSLNIDGLSLGQGLAFSSGLFDVAQVEVLKGPQALFYGKSSPGGVLSLRTADPTNQFELKLRAGYEIEAREKRVELILSGPLGDTLKARLASSYAKADGYFRNIAVALPQFGAAPPSRRDPQPESAIVRGTLLWDPSSQFSARLKVNYTRDHSRNFTTAQLKSCPDGPGEAPLGIPFTGNDDCRMDRNLRIVGMDPAYFPDIPHNGSPFLDMKQVYGTLELNYDVTPALTLTSTSSAYKLTSESLANPQPAASAGPSFAIYGHLNRREITQELRLNSDFDDPLNFTLGGFFQDGRIFVNSQLRGNSAYRMPKFLSNYQIGIDIKTYSAFGQLRWQVSPKTELAGGLRWTDEARTQAVTDFITGTPRQIIMPTPKIHSSNLAPEFTVTHKPVEDVTLFASYKRAFKSGSFTTSYTVGADNSFGDEKVKGGEIGLKSRLFDRSLNFNIAGYYYVYDGLQVGTSQAQAPGKPIFITVVNAGSAKSYGVDMDAVYYPPSLNGFSLNASVNWNRGQYEKLENAPCYAGQRIDQGCDRVFNSATRLYTAQNLSGTPLIRAPEWQASFGFNYELPVGSNMGLVIGNNNQFSSKYVTVLAKGRPGSPPDNYQTKFLKSDVSLTLKGPEDQWEVAAIGKNITDKITSGNCSAVNLANGVVLGGSVIGGTTSGPAGFAEMSCWSDPGREVWLRFTYRFNNR